jgi:hypothetical protein
MTAGARYHFDNGRSIPGASVSDAAIGRRPIRYSIDGRVVEPDATTDAFLEPVQRLVQNVEAEGERALNELARLMNSGLNPYDTSVPEDCPIAVRGFLFFKNADDLARVDTYKADKDRAALLAHMYQNLVKLGEFAHLLATDADHRMWQRNQQRPAEVQAYGEVIRGFNGMRLPWRSGK